MQILKIELKNNHIFPDNTIEFCNGENARINTISGKNGSGKTTIFSLATLVQKAFFCKLLEKETITDEYFDTVNERVTTEIMHSLANDGSSVTLVLNIERSDMNLITSKRALNIWERVANGNKSAEVTLTISVASRTENTCDWNLQISDDHEKLISFFWNLNNPTNLIVYIPADKLVAENDVKYEDVKLESEKGLSQKLKILFDFSDIYNKLYSIILNDYVKQRIIPTKGKARRDLYVSKSKEIFDNLIPEICIGNVSSRIKKNQFIITANRRDNPKHKYEIRDFSSGEKLIWYTAILLNYIKNIGILIIDEPENHLHEGLLWEFVQFLQEVCNDPKSEITLTQVFLLTHSKNLIYNNFSEGKNYVVINGQIVQLQYDACEQLLRNIGVSCITEKILFVEGTTDESTLTEVFSRYNIQIEVLGSCDQIIKAYEGVQSVSTHVQDKRFMFLLDRDTRDEEDIQRLRNENQSYFDEHVVFMKKHELENYYLDEKVIAHVVNNVCEALGKPPISEVELTTIIKGIADGTKAETEKKYLNYLLHTKVHHMDSLFKKSSIVCESEDEYKNYLENVFESREWKEAKISMQEFYNKMSLKYSQDEWDRNWKALCDGKMVFNMCLGKLKAISGAEEASLKRKIINDCLKNKESELYGLIELIITKY